MSKQLQIIPLTSGTSQTLDKPGGLLTLKQAGTFAVKLSQYRQEIQKIDEQIAAKRRANEVEYKKYEKIYDQKAEGGWTEQEKVTQKANNKVRKEYQAKMDAEIAALEKKKDAIKASYKDVNWCWQIVNSGLDGTILTRNTSIPLGLEESAGSGDQSITFPELLEGGGMAWLEAFRSNDPATGKIPDGIYVQAIGTPGIVRCEWTDPQYNPIQEPVDFGSEVLLHIYTTGLYGQEIRVELLDSDFWFFDSDDSLKVGKANDFIVEVDVYKIKAFEDGKKGIDGLLNAESGKGVAQKQFIQKAVIPVLVDRAWLRQGGSSLKIYPAIKILRTGKVFEKFDRLPLQVKIGGRKTDDPNVQYNNNPVLTGNIETNTAAFSPCKYDKIELIDKEGKSKVLFDKSLQELPAVKVYLLCAGIDRKDLYTLSLGGVNVADCRLAKTTNSHAKNTWVVSTKPENFEIAGKSEKDLIFRAGFGYHNATDTRLEKLSFKILEYIWPLRLPKDNNQPLRLIAQTCRYRRPIQIVALPDVKWTLDLRFGMKGPEQYTHTNLPTYDRRNDTSEGKVNSRYSQAQEKAINAGKTNYRGYLKKKDGMPLEFQLVLKAEYNRGDELELAARYAEKVEKFLNMLISFKEKLDSLTNIDKVNAGHKSMVQTLSKKLWRAPITGSLDYPAISVGGKWQAALDKNSEPIIDGKAMLRFNPLLKGDVSLDIVAAASYVPVFGQAVKAVEIALNTAGTELNFMLTLFGQINVEAEYAFASIGGTNLNVNGELGLKLVLSAKVKINMNAVVFQVNGEVSAEGVAVTSIKPKLSIGHNPEGTYLEAKCDFMGVNIVVTVVGISGKKSFQYKDTFTLLPRKDNFVNGRTYIVS